MTLFFYTPLIVQRMSMFPMYFAVQHGGEQYKLYQNSIYDLPEKVNVIWPINNVEGLCETMRLRDEKDEYSLSRSWNGINHAHLNWRYTGSSIKIILKNYNMVITAAVISMSFENIEKLPYCPCSFIPMQSSFIGEKDISYAPARVYVTDPNSYENTQPIPTQRVPLASVAPSASMAPLASVAPLASAAPLASGPTPLPPHITKIVLADAIRKNEVCPITSEDITETNATVTPCGHVFTTAAITHWLGLPSSKGLCPVCKQKC